jgi:hypothetical protein
MAIDPTGGLDVSREYVFAECPESPCMRDAVNMWVSDDRGVLGLPRFAVEALAPGWDSHELSANIAFPDGRVFRVRGKGPAHPTRGPEGLPTVFGAGPLAFRCIEPFRRWIVSYDGPALEMTSAAQAARNLTGPSVDLAFHIETTMAVPPWIQGRLSTHAASLLDSAIEGDFMGGPRYEQLFRAKGTLRIGEEQHSFTGSGLRIRRQGIRKVEGFWGHCWQSALFPSGRAFGFLTYPPRPDGKPSYNEGFAFDGDGALIPARVVQVPWITRLQPGGENVSFVLETDRGRVAVEGETILSTFEIGNPQFPLALQQGGVRYR